MWVIVKGAAAATTASLARVNFCAPPAPDSEEEMIDRNADDPGSPLSISAQGWTLAAVSVLEFLGPLMIAPLLPILSRVFAGTAHADLLVRMIVSMPALAAILSGPVLGLLQQRCGAKRLLLTGLCTFAVGALCTVIVSGLPAILAAQLLQGFGATITTTSAMTIVANIYCTEDRHAVLARRGLLKVSGAVFSLMSGYLAQYNWRLVFAIFPLCLMSVPLVARWVIEANPRARQSQQTRDGEGKNYPLTTSRAKRSSVAAMVSTAAFAGGALICIPSLLPFLVETHYAATPVWAGALTAAYTLSGLAAVSFRTVRRHTSAPGLCVLLFCVIGAGYFLISTASSPIAAIVGVTVAGLGGCLMIPNLNSWAMQIAPSPSYGHNLALMQLGLSLGTLSAPLLIQPLIGQLGISHTFGALGSTFAVLALGSALIRSRHRPSRLPVATTAQMKVVSQICWFSQSASRNSCRRKILLMRILSIRLRRIERSGETFNDPGHRSPCRP